MRTLFTVLCLLATLTVVTNAQIAFIPMGVVDVVVSIEKPVIINGQVQEIPHGTGFFFQDSTTGAVFLVTNRHILAGHDSLSVRFNIADGTTRRFTLLLQTKDRKATWLAHRDTTIDVAIIPVPDRAGQVKIIDSPRLKSLSEIEPGDEVYFIGFPLAEYAGQTRVYPVFRHGIVAYIAQETILSLMKADSVILQKGMILVDATSMGGNSGGPVISNPRKGTERASLIGIIQGHLSIGNNSENADLGIVVPADRIAEIIRDFTQRP
jgi:S1-C subfamily serine protease